MGKARNKGKYAEYTVRDLLRGIGFEDARRITMSGWGEDLEGDLIFDKNIKAEVKAKQSLLPKSLISAKGECDLLFIKPDGQKEPYVFMDWKAFCKMWGRK